MQHWISHALLPILSIASPSLVLGITSSPGQMAVELDRSQVGSSAEKQQSLADFVGQQTNPPADGTHTRIIPLEVKPASQEHLPAGWHLRDALRDPEQKKYAKTPAAQLLGEMVCSSQTS